MVIELLDKIDGRKISGFYSTLIVIENNGLNYGNIISSFPVASAQDLFDIFWNKICQEWTEEYRKKFPHYGEVTLSRYHAFAFTIDHEINAGPETPETRVISFFGISNND